MDKYAAQKRWAKEHPTLVEKYRKRWARKNRDHIRQHAKEYNAKRGHVIRVKDLRIKYGLTPIQYDAMMIAQNHRCAICGKTPQENGKYLTIDHCHKTKKVRGLLCYRCNTGLASFKDELPLVVNAMTYLQQALAKAEKGE